MRMPVLESGRPVWKQQREQMRLTLCLRRVLRKRGTPGTTGG